MLSRYRLLPVIAALLVLVVAACNGTPAPPGDQAQSGQLASTPTLIAVAEEPAVASPTVPEPTPTLEPIVDSTPTAVPIEAATTAQPETIPATEEPLAEVSPTPAAEEAEQPPTTESMAVGMSTFPATPTAQGEVILVTGQVLDTSGAPLPGAAVEIWQTDASGVYDHPGDRSTGQRDRGFQFYGTAIADDTGTYIFRTVKPGEYEPRPRHIHVKVKIDGQEVLTTQFYFLEDQASLPGEGVFQQAGSQGELLLLQTTGNAELGGSAVPVLSNDLVVDIGTGTGTLSPTPAQSEGPYYPVIIVAEYDNDLAVVP